MDMTVPQFYHLAHTAYKKLSAEESRPDGSLRLLISHGNLVDLMMDQVPLIVKEQNAWFHRTAGEVVRASNEPAHIKQAYTDFLRSRKDRTLEPGSLLDSNLQTDSDSESDSDTDTDSDPDIGTNLECNRTKTTGMTLADSTSGSTAFLYPFVVTTTEIPDGSLHSAKEGVSKISLPLLCKKFSMI